MCFFILFFVEAWILPPLGSVCSQSYIYHSSYLISDIYTSWCFHNTICYSFYIFWAENADYNLNSKVIFLNRCHPVANNEIQHVFHDTVSVLNMLFSLHELFCWYTLWRPYKILVTRRVMHPIDGNLLQFQFWYDVTNMVYVSCVTIYLTKHDTFWWMQDFLLSQFSFLIC